MEQQEYLIKLQMLEQQANQFGEQLKIIDQQMEELDTLKDNIGKLSSVDESEMFSEIGKGIYIKTQLSEKYLLVDVGNKILVPKTGEEIQKIVDDQKKKFDEVKTEISHRIDEVNKELNDIISNSENEGDKKESSDEKSN